MPVRWHRFYPRRPPPHTDSPHGQREARLGTNEKKKCFFTVDAAFGGFQIKLAHLVGLDEVVAHSGHSLRPDWIVREIQSCARSRTRRMRTFTLRQTRSHARLVVSGPFATLTG